VLEAPDMMTRIHAAGGRSASGWDRAGVVASIACAVHCTLLPIVVAMLPIVGLRHLLSERFEWTMIAATAVIGMAGHTRAYSRNHRHLAPALIFAGGLALVVGVRLFLEAHRLAPWAFGLGGGLAAASHWANLRLCGCCDTALENGMDAVQPSAVGSRIELPPSVE
jgi:hypothetical protein